VLAEDRDGAIEDQLAPTLGAQPLSFRFALALRRHRLHRVLLVIVTKSSFG
jgi:hypothetical protein